MNATSEGLYTEEQIKYVNSVKDEQLRNHLLHQVRLRDNMEQDRDSFEKESLKKNTVEHAMKVLVGALKADEGYKIGWKSNIAMAFKDEYANTPEVFQKDIHIIANQAADNFLKLLCS
jgi:hypothetical protein